MLQHLDAWVILEASSVHKFYDFVSHAHFGFNNYIFVYCRIYNSKKTFLPIKHF